MARLQLHGIVPGGTARRVAGGSHQVLSSGRLAALVSDYAHQDPLDQLDPEDLTQWAAAHHDVLCAYCADLPLVPMRLGAVFSGQEAVAATLKAQSTALTAHLETLAGLREYMLRLAVTDAPLTQTKAETGRGHLRQRKARRDAKSQLQRERQRLSETILSAFKAITVQVTSTGNHHADRLVDCAGLVPLGQIAILATLPRQFDTAATSLGLDLVISGPWPAYSFDPKELRGIADAS